MSVYVDRVRDWGWVLGPSCHMIADTNEELHKFATRIGMKRKWFQKSTSGPHYDLTFSRRLKAVELGAIELEDRQFHEVLKKWRKEALEAIKLETTQEGRKIVLDYLYR